MAISKNDYLRALNPSNQKNGLSPEEEGVLRAIFEAKNHSASATELAAILGLAGHTAANGAFIRSAKKIATELGLGKTPNSRGEPRWWPHLATMPGNTESGSPWTLHPEFVAALKAFWYVRESPSSPSEIHEGHPSVGPANDAVSPLSPKEPTPARSSKPLTKLRVLDQFDVGIGALPQPVQRMTNVFLRNPRVREAVKERADGKCEWCGAPGFPMLQGVLYLETHHVVPLSEGGADLASNVVALCANHHREAHHGLDRASMRVAMLSRILGK